MAIFNLIDQTTSFLSWLNSWNIIANETNPSGTGTLSVHNLTVTGDITYGSSVMSTLYKKEVEAYILDSTNPPSVADVLTRKCSQFSASLDKSIWFNFNLSNFPDITSDRYIYLSYCMSSAQSSAGVVLHADYYVGKSGIAMTSAATGTSRVTITPLNATEIFDYTDDLVIDGGDLTSRDDWVYVKLSRLGSAAADTHSGLFDLFDIRVI